MPVASIKKFKVGDEILCFKNPELGPGKILGINVSHIVIYLGRNEWLTEYLTCATVQFANSVTKNILLKDLIKLSIVSLFETLQPGDMISIGKNKKTFAIVIGIFEIKKKRKNVVSKRKVQIFDGFKKSFLQIRKHVEILQRI